MQSDWDLNIKEVFKFHQALEEKENIGNIAYS